MRIQNIRIFAEQKKAIEDLNSKLLKLNEEAKSIQATADAEHRALSEEEERTLNAIFDAFEATEAEIQQRQRLETMEEKLAQPNSRITPASEPSLGRGTQARTEPRGGDAGAVSVSRIDSVLEAKGSWGWRTFGEFALGVRAAPRGKVDPRLVQNAPSPLTSEGIGADGGYAVPPDFRTEIVSKVMGEEALLARTDMQITTSNQLTVPVDETTPWQATGGIQAHWEGEGTQIKQSKAALTNATIRANKLTALVPVTDELLEDASSLGNYLRRKTPEKFNYKITDAILNGDGVGKPKGIMNSNFKVAVAKEAAQAADTVKFENIVKMWSAMFAGYRKNGVWLINQDVEPQLQSMVLSGSVGGPAYLPPGGLSASPYATLMGRPVIVTEAAAALGDEGDIMFVDLLQYLTVVKSGGIRQDVSIHLWFDYDVTAFRFIMRVGGQPWFNSNIVRAKGAQALSAFVTLAARA